MSFDRLGIGSSCLSLLYFSHLLLATRCGGRGGRRRRCFGCGRTGGRHRSGGACWTDGAPSAVSEAHR